MPYREITLTKQLLRSKLARVKKRYDQIYINSKTCLNRSFIKSMEKTIARQTIYCFSCGEPIDETYIGQKIVSTDNCSDSVKKWYHHECAVKKNLI